MSKQRREWAVHNGQVRDSFVQQSTQISQLSDRITLQATSISNLSGTVEEYHSELVLADEGISTEVSKKVGNDEIISRINQSPESVTIDASKITLASDVVTFTKMSAGDDLTLATSDSGGNTLTISGSRMTGTDGNGYIGYVVRPYGYDIYSYDSANTLIATVRARTGSQFSKPSSGTLWERTESIYGTIWGSQTNGVGFGIRVPRTTTGTSSLPVTAYNYYLTYAINGNADHYIRCSSFVVSRIGTSGISSTVVDLSDSSKAIVIDGEETRIGTTVNALNLRGTEINMKTEGAIDISGFDGTYGMKVDGGWEMYNNYNGSTARIKIDSSGNVQINIPSGKGVYLNGSLKWQA